MGKYRILYGYMLQLVEKINFAKMHTKLVA